MLSIINESRTCHTHLVNIEPNPIHNIIKILQEVKQRNIDFIRPNKVNIGPIPSNQNDKF